jgi:hypothetical protein
MAPLSFFFRGASALSFDGSVALSVIGHVLGVSAWFMIA